MGPLSNAVQVHRATMRELRTVDMWVARLPDFDPMLLDPSSYTPEQVLQAISESIVWMTLDAAKRDTRP